MAEEGKKNTDKWFPVILVDDTDFKTAETGKLYSDITVKYSYEAAISLTTYTVASGNWAEAGEGKYWLQIGASEFTAEGKYEVSVACTGCITFNFAVEVRNKTITEMIDDVVSILTDTNELQANQGNWATATGFATSTALSTHGGKLDTVDGVVDAIKAKTDNLPASPAATSDIPTAAQNADAVWDEAISGHNTGGTFGAKNQKVVPSETIGDYKADVSGLATSSELSTHDGKLDTVDGIIDAIKAKTDNLPASPAAISDIPTAAQNAHAVWDEAIVDHQTVTTFGGKNQKAVPSETLNDYKTDVSGLATSSELATHDGKLDTVDGVVDAIKLKTDNLPVSPAATGDIPSADDIADQVWEESIADHQTGTTFGGKNQNAVPSEVVGDYKANVSGLATSAEISALNDISATDVKTQADQALTDYDSPTKAELDSGLAGLNDLSAADVKAQADQALTDYDPPTKAELDSGLAGLNDPTPAAIADAVWDEAIADHNTADTFGAKNQLKVPSEAIGDYKADVSSLATSVELSTHDGKLDTVDNVVDAIKLKTDNLPASPAASGDIPTAAENADAVWDEAIADHQTAATFGVKNQKVVPSENAADYKADVSGLSTSAEIAALNDISAADVKAQADQALTDYDPPTKAEMDGEFAGLNNFDPANDQVNLGKIKGAALTETNAGDLAANVSRFFDVNPVTVKTVDDVGGDGALSTQDIRDAMKLAPSAGAPADGSIDKHLDTIEADTNELQGNQSNWETASGFVTSPELAAHDSKLDTVDGVVDLIKLKTDNLPASPAATGDIPTAEQNADAVWDEPVADHAAGTTFGGKNQKAVPSEAAGDYKADVSGLATSAELAAHDGKLDTVDGVVDAIKAKTDNLPVDPAAQSDITGLNDLTAAEVRAEADAALAAYDGPTKAELDAAKVAIQGDISGLNDLAPTDVADAVWDAAIVDHNNVDTFGAKNQKAVPSEAAEDYRADVSGLATSAEISALNDLSSADVKAKADQALIDYDAPTKAELDTAQDAIQSDIAGLNDLSAAEARTQMDAALIAYDAPTKAELDTGLADIQGDIAGLNDLTAADIRMEADAALAAYDPPTKAELDNDVALVQADIAAIPSIQADDIFQRVIEGTVTFEQVLRALLAIFVGLSSGGGEPVIAFRDYLNTKDRIVATVDENGNRLNVVLDLN